MNIFDLQFWVICILFGGVIFLSYKLIKKGLVNAVSVSVAEVVKDQWASMFKKLDSYQEIVRATKDSVSIHEFNILELKERCGKLEKKGKIDRKDLDAIIV